MTDTMLDWTTLNTAGGKGQLFLALDPLTPQQRLTELTRYIEHQIAFIRQQGGADTDTSSTRSFLAIGFDSLMSVELLYCLQRDLGREIDPIALERETIDELASGIAAEVWGEA
ncbi:acyl carrier protein (plasmid) [Deinococcus sp. KNUC1210]|uniref:acyl carrier protein n=1 Tax=Deinococcus sp. KNUC1210 TaxID=2917691 RepID=UPI001EEFD658|nr:acyl carrier protein [Deinococcus sp. KNUC1210]ULH14286.1 acyl carrier protein [Deinococcus sp. KNUC1210]